mmetsp:Transcript_80558/g.207345  ORF Transcript_80558/g.207345 Transcript_80558/m.207345 type:complete len:606 (-) Transcript_80558:586-2403(-)
MAPISRTALVALLGFSAALARPVEFCRDSRESCWQNKVVYQVITDRFAPSNGSEAPCDDLSNYCGGTWKGIVDHLDYIQGLGADAIWISPVVLNTPKGYHGYWARSLIELNPEFGAREELDALTSECHSRGMMVLADVVANHMGMDWADIPMIEPFNETQYYHNCDICVAAGATKGGCKGGVCECSVEDYDNSEQELNCQLMNLPDLDQDQPFVRKKLFEFARDLVWIHGFDGLRIDTVPYVKKEFWKSFRYAAQRRFSLGEVSSPDNGRVFEYVETEAMDSVINYPLYFQLRNSFRAAGQAVVRDFNGKAYENQTSMVALANLVADQRKYYGPFKMPVLGNFAESHDVFRLPSLFSDLALRKSMILYTLAAEGISLIYYGMEQDLDQADFGIWDSHAWRVPLWTTGYKTADAKNGMYDFIARVNLLKHRMPIIDFRNASQVELHVQENILVFQRGCVVVALTNAGSNSGEVMATVSVVSGIEGSKLCNIYGSVDDCVILGAGGSMDISLKNGGGKVYAPEEYVLRDLAPAHVSWWTKPAVAMRSPALILVLCVGVVGTCCLVLVRGRGQRVDLTDRDTESTGTSVSADKVVADVRSVRAADAAG